MNTLKLTVTVACTAIVIYLLKQYMNGPMCESKARLDGKVVLVTGANTGIGKETALDLVQRGGKVYLACRSVSKCDSAVKDIIEETHADKTRVISMQLDLASTRSIRTFVNNFAGRETKLDILINNAGVAWILDYTTTEEGFETTFGVNHLGHFLLTHLLIRLMVDNPSGSRVVNVASSAHRFVEFQVGMPDDKNYSALSAYPLSKLANILFTKELGRRVKEAGITTYSLHPGVILTELMRHIPFGETDIMGAAISVLGWPFVKSLKHGAQTTICCAVDEKLATETGKYYKDCAESESSLDSQSEENAKALWEFSRSLLKLQASDLHPLMR